MLESVQSNSASLSQLALMLNGKSEWLSQKYNVNLSPKENQSRIKCQKSLFFVRNKTCIHSLTVPNKLFYPTTYHMFLCPLIPQMCTFLGYVLGHQYWKQRVSYRVTGNLNGNKENKQTNKRQDHTKLREKEKKKWIILKWSVPLGNCFVLMHLVLLSLCTLM